MATIESTWSLLSSNDNEDMIPKCLAVYITPAIPIKENFSSSSTQVKMFDVQVPGKNTNKGSSSVSTNPFDMATTGTGTTVPTSTSVASMSSNTMTASSSTSLTSNYAFAYINKVTHSVLYGTNYGTLHYRTFPLTSKYNTTNSSVTGMSNTSSSSIISPIGTKNGNITTNIHKTGMGGGGSGNQKSPFIHSLHQPMDFTTLLSSYSSIVSCIQATPPSLNHSKISSTSASASKRQYLYSQLNPIFLLLQDDSTITIHNDSFQNSSGSIYSISHDSQHSTHSSSNHNHNNENNKTFHAQLISLSFTNHYKGSSSSIASSSSSSDNYNNIKLPRMSNVTYHPNTGYVYALGSSIYSLSSNIVHVIASSMSGASNTSSSNGGGGGGNNTVSSSYLPKIYYHNANILPSSSNNSTNTDYNTTTTSTTNSSLSIICNGHVIILAMKNGSFYAVNGINVNEQFWKMKLIKERRNKIDDNDDDDEMMDNQGDVEKVISFQQSSPVHPSISVEIPLSNNDEEKNDKDILNNKNYEEDEVCTSLLFLASGQKCAIVEILYNPKLYSNNRRARMMMNQNDNNNMYGTGVGDDDEDDMQVTLLPSPSMNCGSIVVGKPRHGIATLASPILAAVGLTHPKASSSSPLVAILTSDGLVHTRSPSFISIPLCTIEVGNRPNDFFTLQALPNKKVVVGSYSGEARLIAFREDTEQDLADRMMKLAIDAFGSNGFPRAELAKATGATFTATSYVGSEPTADARNTLKQYLETCLGLDMSGDFGAAALYKQFLHGGGLGGESDDDFVDEEGSGSNVSMSPFASVYLCATAMLCLVCSRVNPPNSSLANRAAKSCTNKFGRVTNIQQNGINEATMIVCEIVADQLLKESESTRIVPALGGLATGKNGIRMDMVEAASWLLRSCGQHQRSIQILQDRMDNPSIRNKTFVEGTTEVFDEITFTKSHAGWSQTKYESHLCLHLGDLWSCGDVSCRDLVLASSATRNLLENNPTLGLKIFTSMLPQNEQQWSNFRSGSHPEITHTEVVEMLKSICPHVPRSRDVGNRVTSDFQLPLESGRALAVAYLECVIGIATGKPPTIALNISEENQIEMNNELAFLLLEGCLSERSTNDVELDSELGKVYREKLRRLLGWHSSKVQPDNLMDILPKSFLREKALLLGQLGRHEDALRIFYFELKSLDLALEYCDARYEKQQAMARDNLGIKKLNQSCAYLPLVRVALESDQDAERGTAAAIQVLSLRRRNIDRVAALRLLPKSVPISSLARTFLIPALIDSESQTRRLTVTASLLRAKYLRLKQSLTEAQIKSQSILQNVPALQTLNLSDPVYTSNSFKARPSNVSSLHFPEVTITKYFFPRYVIIQATATATNCMVILRDVQLVVAESSDEALLPSVNIPIKTLPPGMTGSSWCVLSASPQRLDGTAILVCEIHYSVSSLDSSSNSSYGPGRVNVEEIQDIEIRRAEFEG